MNAIDQGLSDYADALRAGAGSPDDIVKYRSASIYYDPGRIEAGLAQMSQFPNVNMITFGRGIEGYAASVKFSRTVDYFGLQISSGGRGAIFAIVAHEFGYVTAHSRLVFNELRHLRPTSSPAIEAAANRHVCMSAIPNAQFSMSGVNCR